MGLLPDGRRLHLQDGPIDLVIEAVGSVAAVAEAYRAATQAFIGLLDALCGELSLLRSPARPGEWRLGGPVARRMEAAVQPFAATTFITPMAAVAGAVADTILTAMVARAPLRRASVNNGGDIALHCGRGECLRVGMIDRPDRPQLFGRVVVTGGDEVRGIATSGWRGRSFSLGLADSVTVLARSAAEADAAATIIANAVDLPGHPAVMRRPANTLQPDSDLGDRLVTCKVGPLAMEEIGTALAAGLACADELLDRRLLVGAALQVQGAVRTTGLAPGSEVAGPSPSRHDTEQAPASPSQRCAPWFLGVERRLPGEYSTHA